MKKMMMIMIIPSSTESFVKRTMAAQVKRAFNMAKANHKSIFPKIFNVITFSIEKIKGMDG
jgi:hypothetical protein